MHQYDSAGTPPSHPQSLRRYFLDQPSYTSRHSDQANTPSELGFLPEIPRPVITGFLLLLFGLSSPPMASAGDSGDRHCLMGCPTHPKVSDSPIVRSLYSLMNDPRTKFARWVAYRVVKSNFDCDAAGKRK